MTLNAKTRLGTRLPVMMVCCGVMVVGASMSIATRAATAETAVVEAIRLSDLGHGAMECSQLTRDADEEKRLFDVATTAGKAFLGAFDKLNVEEKEQVKGKLNFDWWFAYNSPGSYDFKLGKLWAIIKFERDSDFEREDEERRRQTDYDLRKRVEENRYKEKNCAFIR